MAPNDVFQRTPETSYVSTHDRGPAPLNGVRPALEKDHRLRRLQDCLSRRDIGLVDGGQIRHLEIAADGRVEVPIEQGLADRDAQLWLKKPDSAPHCQIFTNVTAKLPAGLEWRYRDLSAFSEQMQAFIKQSAGMLSLFAPKLRGLLIRFEEDHTAQLIIHASSGKITLQSTAGELRLPIDERLSEENPTVSLSAPALAIDGWLDD